MTLFMHSDLLLLAPPERADHLLGFIGRCLVYGVDFDFQAHDSLPCRISPECRTQAVLVDEELLPVLADSIRELEERGARIYLLHHTGEFYQGLKEDWMCEKFFHYLAFDAGLSYNSPRLAEKLRERDDEIIFQQLLTRITRHRDVHWGDVTKYHWQCLLDAHRLTGNEQYFETAWTQMHLAMRNENDLSNCDAVSPFKVMLELYERHPDEKILHYVVEHCDRYLRETRRYKGCFVNLASRPNCVRSEIVFQVCPSLAWATRVTDEARYLEIALEQVFLLDELLRDAETGLWHHGLNDHSHSGALWARGLYQCLALVQILEAMERSHPLWDEVHELLRIQVAAACAWQDEQGAWHQVVNDLNSDREASGTAWMAAVLFRSVRHGWIGPEYAKAAENAWQWLKTRTWSGFIAGSGISTTVSLSNAYYYQLVNGNLGWSHFAFTVACARKEWHSPDFSDK